MTTSFHFLSRHARKIYLFMLETLRNRKTPNLTLSPFFCEKGGRGETPDLFILCVLSAVLHYMQRVFFFFFFSFLNTNTHTDNHRAVLATKPTYCCVVPYANRWASKPRNLLFCHCFAVKWFFRMLCFPAARTRFRIVEYAKTKAYQATVTNI